MIHFVPNMILENLTTMPTYTKRKEFWNSKTIRKLPKTPRFQDLQVFVGFAGALRLFALFFFCGVLCFVS